MASKTSHPSWSMEPKNTHPSRQKEQACSACSTRVWLAPLAAAWKPSPSGDILISSTVDTLSSVGQASGCAITCEAVSLSIAASYHIRYFFATVSMIYATLGGRSWGEREERRYNPGRHAAHQWR